MLKAVKERLGINAALEFIEEFNRTEKAKLLWDSYFMLLENNYLLEAKIVGQKYKRECLRFAIGE